MLLEGIWKKGELTCPYCGRQWRPRRFSNLKIKQCPECHRYFTLPDNLVTDILRIVEEKKKEERREEYAIILRRGDFE